MQVKYPRRKEKPVPYAEEINRKCVNVQNFSGKVFWG